MVRVSGDGSAGGAATAPRWPPVDEVPPRRGPERIAAGVGLAAWLALGVVLLELVAGIWTGPVPAVVLAALALHQLVFYALVLRTNRAVRRALAACRTEDAPTRRAAALAVERALAVARLHPLVGWPFGPTLRWFAGLCWFGCGEIDRAIGRMAAALPRRREVRGLRDGLVSSAQLLLGLQLNAHDVDGARRTVAIGARAAAWATPSEVPRIAAWAVVSEARIEAVEERYDEATARLATVPSEVADDPGVRGAAALAQAVIDAVRTPAAGAAAWDEADVARRVDTILVALAGDPLVAMRDRLLGQLLAIGLHTRRRDVLVQAAEASAPVIEAQGTLDGLEDVARSLELALRVAGDRRPLAALLAIPLCDPPDWWVEGAAEIERLAPDLDAWATRCAPALLAGSWPAEPTAEPPGARDLQLLRRWAGPERVLEVLDGARDLVGGEEPVTSLCRAEALTDLGRCREALELIESVLPAIDDEIARDEADLPDVPASTGLARLVLDHRRWLPRAVAIETAARAGDRAEVDRLRSWQATHTAGRRLYAIEPALDLACDALLALHDGDVEAGRALLDRSDEQAVAHGVRPLLDCRLAWVRLARELGHEAAVATMTGPLTVALEESGYPAFAREVASWGRPGVVEGER